MSRRIQTLEGLVAEVRHMTGKNPSRALATDEYDRIKYLLQAEQRRLWTSRQWRFLRKRFQFNAQPGEQFYDIPPGLDLNKSISIRVKFGNQWLPLTQGITEVDYALYDSDNAQTADPVLKWDIVDTQVDPDAGATPQLELWPIPVGVQPITMWGTAELGKFVDDNDNCTLDADLLVLFTAALVDKEDATLLPRAKAYLTDLKAGESRRSDHNKVNMNEGRQTPPWTARKRIVVLKG